VDALEVGLSAIDISLSVGIFMNVNVKMKIYHMNLVQVRQKSRHSAAFTYGVHGFRHFLNDFDYYSHLVTNVSNFGLLSRWSKYQGRAPRISLHNSNFHSQPIDPS
jgi:hypothetical protein